MSSQYLCRQGIHLLLVAALDLLCSQLDPGQLVCEVGGRISGIVGARSSRRKRSVQCLIRVMRWNGAFLLRLALRADGTDLRLCSAFVVGRLRRRLSKCVITLCVGIGGCLLSSEPSKAPLFVCQVFSVMLALSDSSGLDLGTVE